MESEAIEKRIEIAKTILLSAVIVITAWCSYQASQWSSITSFRLSEAKWLSIKASNVSLTAEQRLIVDAFVVVNFANAIIDGNNKVADFYMRHLRPEFSDLLKSWLATGPLENPDAPPHPIAMPQYAEIRRGYEAGVYELQEKQEQMMEEAYAAKTMMDAYTFKTVLLASVLFIGGIFPSFRSLRLRLAFLIFDYAIAVVILGQVLKLAVA